MCEFSEKLPGKLIAWLDHELENSEAAEVERHVSQCAECQREIAAYEKIGGMISGYCDETLEAAERRRTAPWAPVLAAVAAVAVVAIVLSFPRTRAHMQVHQQSAASANPEAAASLTVAAPPPAPEAPAAAPVETALAPVQKIHQPHIRKVAPRESASWSADIPGADAPSVEIAIPAEDIFPPGVFPAGVSFVADLSVAADGSARTLRLRPY
jgi:anti-sigma factor RsiW